MIYFIFLYNINKIYSIESEKKSLKKKKIDKKNDKLNEFFYL